MSDLPVRGRRHDTRLAEWCGGLTPFELIRGQGIHTKPRLPDRPRPLLSRKGERTPLRRWAAGVFALALLAFAPASTAGPVGGRSAAATKTVRITLSDTGKGRWSTAGDAEKGSLAINYKWSGTFAFKVPVKTLNDPKHARLSSTAAGTLNGTWVGDMIGTRYSPPNTGDYHCSYSGKNVRARVTAQLVSGPTARQVTIVLRSGASTSVNATGFFPDKGNGAKVACSTPVGADGPPHFEPSWLFRDTVTDHGYVSSSVAVITMPAKLLPRGRVKVRFPHEVGSVHSVERAALDWNNTGTVTAVAR
jgi:hypothetical protein